MEEGPKERGRSLRAGDVYDALVERITSGDFPIGEYLPSERSLIGEFGVSRPTVRKALQRLEHEGHLACHPGIGYEVTRIERRAGRSDSKLVGVLWDGTGRDERVDSHLPKVESELAARGYAMVLAFADRDLAAENKRVGAFLDTGVAGLIVLPAQKGKGVSKLAELIAEGFPIMGVGEPSNWVMGKRGSESCSFVGMDNAMGVRLAVDHFFELGHRRVAFARSGGNPVTTRRQLTYQEWLAEKGLQVREEWVIPCWRREARLPVEELVRAGVGTAQGPTAVFCETVLEAALIGEGLREIGLVVPRDVSVAAFHSGVYPRPQVQGRLLAGLAYSWADYAREIVEGLLAQMRNRSVVRRTLIRPSYVAGETVAAPGKFGEAKLKSKSQTK